MKIIRSISNLGRFSLRSNPPDQTFHAKISCILHYNGAVIAVTLELQGDTTAAKGSSIFADLHDLNQLCSHLIDMIKTVHMVRTYAQGQPRKHFNPYSNIECVSESSRDSDHVLMSQFTVT